MKNPLQTHGNMKAQSCHIVNRNVCQRPTLAPQHTLLWNQNWPVWRPTFSCVHNGFLFTRFGMINGYKDVGFCSYENHKTLLIVCDIKSKNPLMNESWPKHKLLYHQSCLGTHLGRFFFFWDTFGQSRKLLGRPRLPRRSLEIGHYLNS